MFPSSWKRKVQNDEMHIVAFTLTPRKGILGKFATRVLKQQ
jgi:hypothetical protein